MTLKDKLIMFVVIVLAVCLTQFASDIYTPSVSAIATALQVSVGQVQWSMAIYMFGVAVSQLIYGPLSEGIGRKSPLIAGMLIMLLGSGIAYFSPSMNWLLLGRLIQGCGAGACASLWRSVFRDIFTGDDLAKYGSYFTIIITFIVPTAPALGGYLQHYGGWRASFLFMLGYALLSLILMLIGFRETSQHHHKDRLQLSYIKSTYATLLTDHHFMGITLATFLSYGALFASVATFPVLLMHLLNVSPVAFGWISFAGCGGAYALAGFLNGRLVKRFGMLNMVRFGFITMVVAGLWLIGQWLLLGLGVWGVVLPVVLFNFGATFLWPNAFAAAFTPFGHIAGYAGALYGFMQICGGAVLGGLIAYLPKQTPLPLAIVIIAAAVLSWLAFEHFAGVGKASSD